MNQSQIWIGFIATLIIVIVLGSYAAFEPSRMSQAQVRMEEEDVLAASQLYETYCGACHGARGDGFEEIPPLDQPGLREMDKSTLRRIISRGSGDLMPPTSASEGGYLTNAQVDQLVLMIRTGSWSQVRARLDLPGSMALYIDHCAGCHGSNVGGSNFGPRLDTRKVRERMSIEELVRIIQDGLGDDEMPAFSGKLTSEEIAELGNLLRNWEELVEN